MTKREAPIYTVIFLNQAQVFDWFGRVRPQVIFMAAAKVGGIVANNSSGMCCGVKQNTYHTLQDMRVVPVDGAVLDTADGASRRAFEGSHAALLAGLRDLASRVQGDDELMQLIRKKYSIKNTTGYSINALADFSPDNPIEILKRLMIGSEGTRGFVSRVTYASVPDHPCKASAFLVFSDIGHACDATSVLRSETSVDAVEIFDQRSLNLCRKMGDIARLCPELDELPAGGEGAALLIECRGEDEAALEAAVAEVCGALAGSGVPLRSRSGFTPSAFYYKPHEYNTFWDARKGLIPVVGGARESGTVMLLEDVACSTDRLGEMSKDLIRILQRLG